MTITGDSHVLNVITNGTVQELDEIVDHVNDEFPASRVDSFTKETMHGKITPLFMKMNQFRDWSHPLVQKLLQLGANPSMSINYYGRQCSALDIFGSLP
jgi:hypothetical protein